MTRGPIREARDALEEIGAALTARAARCARREDADELVLRERALAGSVGAHAHAAQDDLRGLFEDEEQRLEDDVDDLQQVRRAERHLLGALDGDELRNELAEEHVPEGQHRERDDHDDVVQVLARLAAEDEERGAIDLHLHRGLADPAETEARERDPELRDRQVAIEARDDAASPLDAGILARRLLRVRERRADLDERKLSRDEEAVQNDENGCEEEPEHLGRPL